MITIKNEIQIFQNDFSELDISTIYVTDDALYLFYKTRDLFIEIAEGLAVLHTGTPGPCTPGNLELCFMLTENIDTLEEFLKNANKNDSTTAKKIIDARDLLVKFSNIERLMLEGDKKFRQNAIELFIKTGRLYAPPVIQQFIDLLDENELKYIMQIIHQEKTLIDKEITNTLIHTLAIKRINEMQEIKNKEIGNYDDER